MADKFKEQNRQKKDGGSITKAGQMNVCEGSWTPQLSSVKLNISEVVRKMMEEGGLLISSQEKPRSR